MPQNLSDLQAFLAVARENSFTKAAAKLGINRNTLHKKLKDYNLETPDQAADEET